MPNATPVATASLPALASTTQAPAAVAPIVPPEGIEPGFVAVATQRRDQFGKWVQVSQSVDAAQSTTFTTDGGSGNATRTVWTAWVKLTAPASIAELDAGGEGGGEVSASVDGAALGPTITHYARGTGKQQIASLPLTAGWHEVEVTADQRARAEPLAARVSFGDGTNSPTPVAPWATPARTGAPAAAAISAPASASTTAQESAS